MPKLQYCWRCKCDVPMLDESEWSHVLPSLHDGIREIQRYRMEYNASLDEAKNRCYGLGALDRYFEITGYRETSVDVI